MKSLKQVVSKLHGASESPLETKKLQRPEATADLLNPISWGGVQACGLF